MITKIEDSQKTRILSQGFTEGNYDWMNKPGIDDLALARSFDRPSPRQIIDNLIQSGFIRNNRELPHIEKPKALTNKRTTHEIFPDWSNEDRLRFDLAKQREQVNDPKVMTFSGDLINPDNPEESKQVIFIAAGGLSEGLLTSQGVLKMRNAMEEAEKLQVPIVFLNSVTSADPSFESEVGQISRQISETMALGLKLTVPKITVITGEAASAGAHAGWQIADRTLILDHGALLTVINVDEALDLLRFIPEVSKVVDSKFNNRLDEIGLSEKKVRILNLVKGRDALEKVLVEARQSEQKARIKIENEGTLKAIVDVIKEVDPQSEKIMLIMPADKPRYVEGMLTRGVDMITIHADDWQKRAEIDVNLTKTDLIEQTRLAMQKAQEIKTKENTEIFFRINASNFQKFWQPEDVENILQQLYSAGLTGIRLTEAASTNELQVLDSVMSKIEGDLGLNSGTFKICLSVETDEAIDHLSQTIQEGDISKRVSTVVMGVRDYTKSRAADGVKDREWNHRLVSDAKKRFAGQINKLKNEGWKIDNLQAIASTHNDYHTVHQEVNSAKELGADGILAVAPEQINHTRACYENIFNPDGSLNKERMQFILEKTNSLLKELVNDNNLEILIAYYRRQSYEVYHQYRLKLLSMGNAFPRDLKEMGIVDELISSEKMEIDLTRKLWKNIKDTEQLTSTDIRRVRLLKLARLGGQTLRKTKKIDAEVRKKNAEGRGKRSAQYWLNLLTDGLGFNEEILNDLEPDPALDVLARMGRMEDKSYQGQISEAQSKTGTLSGIITGYVNIGGKDILLIIRDQDFINATAGVSTGEIVRRSCLDAVEKKRNGKNIQAVVYIGVSAGGRVQEGAQALLPSELAVAGLVEVQLAGIKRINIGHTHVLGSDGIGPFYCADIVTLVGGDTELGLAGRRIVEKISPLGRKEFPQGFRLAGYHEKVGNIDNILQVPEELKSHLIGLLNK